MLKVFAILSLLFVSSISQSSVLKVALFLDSGESQSFSAIELARRGLMEAERDFNVFTQIVDMERDARAEDIATGLANNGFDLMIGVGSRAAETLCSMASQYYQTHFVIVEKSCFSAGNVTEMSFDALSIADAISQFVQVHRVSSKLRIAWIEEQSSPRLNAVQDLLKERLSLGRQDAVLKTFRLDRDRLIPLTARIKEENYDAVIVLASAPMQDMWLRYWPKGQSALLLSGPGVLPTGMRLIKKFDHLVYDTIRKSKGQLPISQNVTYGFKGGGLELRFARPSLSAESAYEKVLDLVTRPILTRQSVN